MQDTKQEIIPGECQAEGTLALDLVWKRATRLHRGNTDAASSAAARFLHTAPARDGKGELDFNKAYKSALRVHAVRYLSAPTEAGLPADQD